MNAIAALSAGTPQLPSILASRDSLGLHHLAVETADLDNSVAWYTNFFGGTVSWTLDAFSELTRHRLPGIVRLTEVVACPVRFHLFTRDVDYTRPVADVLQFQHVCLVTDSLRSLASWRGRWQRLYASGAYSFACTEPATEIVTDAGQVSSFYAYDVNGLEFEFTHDPNKAP
jgi:catechol 2,3-dioxygenase-like lactoylglutathione lyase family enzyme